MPRSSILNSHLSKQEDMCSLCSHSNHHSPQDVGQNQSSPHSQRLGPRFDGTRNSPLPLNVQIRNKANSSALVKSRKLESTQDLVLISFASSWPGEASPQEVQKPQEWLSPPSSCSSACDSSAAEAALQSANGRAPPRPWCFAKQGTDAA